MRVLIDYRAALRERSGVGEYTHQLVRALLAVAGSRGQGRDPEVALFSSSSRDRLPADPELVGAVRIDRRVPVRLLNFAWHRLGWPPAEWLTGFEADVTHSMHPLLMPTRRAAQVITIHDLDFLIHPERTRAEIRRDYPALARTHAARADRIVVVSEFTAGQVERLLEVSRDRISVCSPGGPCWNLRPAAPRPGYLLFFGTLEPRKNVGALLEAYEQVLGSRRECPDLVLAGKATAESAPWLERIQGAALRGRVRHLGYVAPVDREALYAGARLLVQPSFEEGFGLPVLEAMTVGVPVVASRAGALPEVACDAALFVDPHDPSTIAAAIARVLDDEALEADMVQRGRMRAAAYTWAATAQQVLTAYGKALATRRDQGRA